MRSRLWLRFCRCEDATSCVRFANERGFDLIAIEAMTDQAHGFVSAPPKVAPSTMVKALKGISAKRLVEQFAVLRIRMNQGHLWHSSATVGTAGHVSAEAIQRYIQEHMNSGEDVETRPKGETDEREN